MTASEFLGWIDTFVTKSVEKSEKKPCCAKGCHHCCEEALYVDGREVDYIIEGMSPELKERVIPRLREWLVRAKPALEMPPTKSSPGGNFDLLDALAYRDLRLPCPLLEDGLCSVYDRRPMSCRLFMATGDPDNCRMPMRRHQGFLEVDWSANEKFWTGLFEKWTRSQPGTYTLDHMGVLLAERLLNEFPQSTIRTVIEITEEE